MKAAEYKSIWTKEEWSEVGTLFHTMLVASKEGNIPLFNEYFLPNHYSMLEGMSKDVNNRWGDKAMTKIMSEMKINETIHDIFGARTMNKKIGPLEKLGLEYMKLLNEHEVNNEIYHKHSFVQSKAAIKKLNTGEKESYYADPIVSSQTLIYNWLTQFQNCNYQFNKMYQSITASENTNYLYEFHRNVNRYLSDESKTKTHVGREYYKGASDFLSVNGGKARLEMNPWRIVPMKSEEDFVSQYFHSEMVNTKYESYTPYWTTIDYPPAYPQFELEQDLKTIISDPNVFQITLSKTHFLFCHRLLGFFCLRGLHPKPSLPEDEYDSLLKLCVNFRQSVYNIKSSLKSDNRTIFSAYEEEVFDVSECSPRGKKIFTLTGEEYENLFVKMADGEVIPRTSFNYECRNLAMSSALASANPRHYARRQKAFYGLCVGMCSIQKNGPYKQPSGGHILADSFITLNDEGFSLKPSVYPESGIYKEIQFHSALRSIYKAEHKPMTWSEIVNDTVEETKVPRPTHASEFIPSWKDVRAPITVNVSGAPPIGFYHKERRCKTCNGRVILTTPAHCKVEEVQCPHCRNGKIEVKE